MKTWQRVSLILCVFGMLKEFRPSDPFLYQYLSGPKHNFTDADISQKIFPAGAYGYMSQVVVVFLITDLLRYKPVIILGGIAGIASWTLLIIGETVASMQWSNFLWGTITAADVAYYTYIYAQVDAKHYQKVTSHTRAAILFGRFLSGLIGQVMISTGTLDYYQLNYLSLGAISLATIWAFFLPPAKSSIYFHRKEDKNLSLVETSMKPLESANTKEELDVMIPDKAEMHSERETEPKASKNRYVQAYEFLWRDFKAAYSNLYVVKWSIWLALASCGGLQLGLYTQALWDTVVVENPKPNGEPTTMFNGGVDSLMNIIAAAATLGTGWLRCNWAVLGDVSLGVASLVIGMVSILASYSNDINMNYFYYIVFGFLQLTMFTIAIGEVSKQINEDSYGLIFGFNTFVALVLQTILTIIVASDAGLALPVRTQILVYGCYFAVLGAVFILMALVALCQGKYRDKLLWLRKT